MRTNLTQDVNEFFGEENLIQQTFTIDDDNNCEFYFHKQKWVVIEHGNQELSLSFENWKKLLELSFKVLNEVDNRKNLTFKNK
jgi:hypothetical protein